MKNAFLFLSLIFIAACAQTAKKDDSQVELYKGFTAYRYKSIYFSSQPDLNKLSELKNAGFAAIVSLRQAKEKEYLAKDERVAAKSAGLAYENVPVKASEKLTNEKLDLITAAVVKHRKKGKILVHCSSGNRTALWVGGHFYKDHGYDKEKAMKMAKSSGLNNDKLIKTLETYLNSK